MIVVRQFRQQVDIVPLLRLSSSFYEYPGEQYFKIPSGQQWSIVVMYSCNTIIQDLLMFPETFLIH